MSSAFVKEDIDVPERITRRRTASGLPPGTINLMTAAGAQLLRQRLAALKNAAADAAEVADLASLLDSATLVEPPARQDEVLFGATVTLRSAAGELKTCRIAGVDEVHLEPHNVSWISAMGKALLGAPLGQRSTWGLEPQTKWTVIKIE